VHAAEAAGGEDADPGALGQVGGRGDRRRPMAATRDDRREIAHAALGHVVVGGQRGERRVVESDPDLAAQHGDRGRHGAVFAHRRLDLPRDPQVVRPRQPVGDDRALERDHRPPVLERLPDLVMHLHARPPYLKGVRPL
jgi:hypothetical protein